MAHRPEHDPATSQAGPRIALLIDCENQSAAQAPQILAKAKQLGRVVQRTAYADWTKSHTGPWAGACKQHGIDKVQVDRTESGKNTVDNYMSAHAARIAATVDIDAICFVTSDSDFSGAATNLRSMGKDVFGIGTASGAYKAFADTCTHFIALDERPPKPASKSKAAAPKPKAATSAPKPKTATPKPAPAQARTAAKPAPKSKKTAPAPVPKKKLQTVPDWVPHVVNLVRTLSEDGDCALLSALGQAMKNSSPPIDHKTLKTGSFKTLTDMLKSESDTFHLTKSGKGAERVCLAPATQKTK